MTYYRSLLKFFSLTYTVSWGLWIAAAAILRAAPTSSGLAAVGGLLYLIGVFAPALVALALAAAADGRAETLDLLQRTIKWSVGARWYLFAIAYMAAIKLAGGPSAPHSDRRMAGVWSGTPVPHGDRDPFLDTGAGR
jgi:hypothetical protein